MNEKIWEDRKSAVRTQWTARFRNEKYSLNGRDCIETLQNPQSSYKNAINDSNDNREIALIS